MTNSKQHLSWSISVGLSIWKKSLLCSTNHLRDQVSIASRGNITSCDTPSITENCIAFSDLPDFFEEVTYIDDRYSIGTEFPDQREELLDIVALQTTGRFVHQNDPCTGGNCPTDFHDLPRSYR